MSNAVVTETSGSGDNKRKRSPEREIGIKGQRTLLDYVEKEGENSSSKRDWRIGCWGFASMRNKARKEGLFTDVQFVVGEGDNRKIFHAHKVMLASASPVFECMFYESQAENKNIIETNDDPEAFEMLLEYIYLKHSELTIKSVDIAQKFFTICEKYLIYKTEEKAKDCIKTVYKNDNDIWHIVQENNLESSCPLLQDKLNDYIMEHTDELFSSDSWLSAPETVVENIVKMDKLNCAEHSLLTAVTKWLYHNKKHVTSKNLMQYYKHIRFSTVSNNELMQFIEKYPKALDPGTSLEILRHVHSQGERKLPGWCSTSKVSRKQELRRFLIAKYNVDSDENSTANDDDEEDIDDVEIEEEEDDD